MGKQKHSHAVCELCGAPAGGNRRPGSQLVEIKGKRHQRLRGGHVRQRYRHADPAFCDIRIPEDVRAAKARGQ